MLKINRRWFTYQLILACCLVVFWLLKFDLVEILLPIILIEVLYYQIKRRHVFYLGALCLVASSILFAITQEGLASSFAIVSYFCFITFLIQTILIARCKIKESTLDWTTFLKKYFRIALPVLCLIVIVLFATQALVQASGDIFVGDFNFPLSYDNYLGEHLQLWNEHGSWSQPEVASHSIFIAPLFFLGSVFSLSIVAFNKLMIVGLLLIAALGSFFFLKKISRLLNQQSLISASIIPFIGAILYAFNPWIIGRLGHYFLAVGYALLPLIALVFIQALRTRKPIYILLTALLFAAAATVPHSILYIGFVLLVIFVVWLLTDLPNDKLAVLRKHVLPSIMILLLFIGFCAVWILPVVVAPQITQGETLSPGYIVRIDDIKVAYENFSFTDVLLSGGKSLQGNIPWQVAGLALLLLVPLGFILNIKKRISWVALVVFLGALILPLVFYFIPRLYFDTFFDAQNPLALSWLVRDPTRTVLLLPFTIIIGLLLTTISLERFFLQKNGLKTTDSTINWNYWKIAGFLAAVSLLVIIYIFPLGKESLTEVYIPLSIPEEYQQIDDQFQSDSLENIRAAWYPSHSGAKEFEWSDEKQIGNFTDRSFDFRTFGYYSPSGRQFHLLLDSNIEAQTPFLKEILAGFGITHLIYKEGFDEEQEATIKNLTYLEGLDTAKSELIGTTLNSFSFQNNPAPIDVGRNTYAVSGGIDVLEKAAGLDSVDLAKDTFIFLDQEKMDPETVQKIVTDSEGVIINNSTKLNLETAFLDGKYFAYPADFTNRGDFENHWSKARTDEPLHGEWHNMLSEEFGLSCTDFDYNRGIAYTFTEPPHESNYTYYKPALTIPIPITESGEYIVLVRYFESPNGGNMQINTDFLSTEIDSSSSFTKFVWQPVFEGNIPAGNHDIKLININGLNAINSIAIVPTEELNQAKAQVQTISTDAKLAYSYPFGFQNLSESRPIEIPEGDSITYEISRENAANGLNSFKLGGENLQVNDKMPTDGIFRIATLPTEIEGNSTFEINDKFAPYYNQRELFYTPEPGSVVIDDNNSEITKVEVRAEGGSDHRRTMTNLIPVTPGNSYFISLLLSGSGIDNLPITVRQYVDRESPVIVNSTKLDKSGSSSETKAQRYSGFVSISPKAQFVKIEIGSKKKNPSNFEISELTFIPQEKIDEITGALFFSPEYFFIPNQNETPEIIVTKKSSTKYLVDIKGSTKPFLLRFSESFNSLWQATIDDEVLPHIPANGVMNGFPVNKQGDFRIVVEFIPQKWFVIGIIITSSLLIAFLFFYLICKPKKCPQKKSSS